MTGRGMSRSLENTIKQGKSDIASLFAAHAAQTAGGSAADFWLGLLNQKLGRTVWSAAGLQDSDAPAVLTAAQWQKLATRQHWRLRG